MKRYLSEKLPGNYFMTTLFPFPLPGWSSDTSWGCFHSQNIYVTVYKTHHKLEDKMIIFDFKVALTWMVVATPNFNNFFLFAKSIAWSSINQPIKIYQSIRQSYSI